MEMYIWKRSDVILRYLKKIWKSADIHIGEMKHTHFSYRPVFTLSPSSAAFFFQSASSDVSSIK